MILLVKAHVRPYTRRGKHGQLVEVGASERHVDPAATVEALAHQVVGAGYTGEVRKEGRTVTKNATFPGGGGDTREGEVYEKLAGTPGIAPGRREGDRIRLPYYPRIVSIDAVKPEDRAKLGKLVKRNAHRINAAVHALSQAGFYYGDPLQFGVDRAGRMFLLDFSNASKRDRPREAERENAGLLAGFYETFGAPEEAHKVSDAGRSSGDLHITALFGDDKTDPEKHSVRVLDELGIPLRTRNSMDVLPPYTYHSATEPTLKGKGIAHMPNKIPKLHREPGGPVYARGHTVFSMQPLSAKTIAKHQLTPIAHPPLAKSFGGPMQLLVPAHDPDRLEKGKAKVKAYERHDARTGKIVEVGQSERTTKGAKKVSKKATVAALAAELAAQAKGAKKKTPTVAVKVPAKAPAKPAAKAKKPAEERTPIHEAADALTKLDGHKRDVRLIHGADGKFKRAQVLVKLGGRWVEETDGSKKKVEEALRTQIEGHKKKAKEAKKQAKAAPAKPAKKEAPKPAAKPAKKEAPKAAPAKPKEAPSGKKPGAQEGNQNAYKGGPKEKPKAATKAKEAPAAPKEDRMAIVARVKAAQKAYNAFMAKHAGMAIFGHEDEARKLGRALSDAQVALYRLDHPGKDTSHLAYKDIGEKVGMARKDIWEMQQAARMTFSTIDWDQMAADPGLAEKLITRDRLLADSTPQHMRDAGMNAATAYLATQVLKAIPPKPPGDSPGLRKAYAKGIERVQRALMQARSVEEVQGVVDDCRNMWRGFEAKGQDLTMLEVARAAAAKVEKKYRDAEERAKPFYDAWKAAESAKSAVQYDKKIKPTDKAKQLPALEAAADKARQAYIENMPSRELDDARRKAGSLRYELEQMLKAKDRADPESWHYAFAALGDRFENLMRYKGAYAETHRPKARQMEKNGSDDWSWAEKEGGTRTTGEKKDNGLPEWERDVPEDPERVGGGQLGKQKPEQVLERFGLRGIEYGNWVAQDERAHHTKKVAEAFLDLADVLGLPHDQVSMKRRLAMAFGARGKGKALAHYERDRKVINMTKFAGGGSLAHEWGHFMDNILSQVTHDDKGGHLSYASLGSMGPSTPPKLRAAYEELNKAMFEGKHRPMADFKPNKDRFYPNSAMDALLEKHGGDAQKAFDEHFEGRFGHLGELKPYLKRVKQAASYFSNKTGQTIRYPVSLKGSSDFHWIAQQMGPYWERPQEMFARAWESYVEDKLAEKGMRNSYLVSGTREGGFRHEGSKKASTFVYPQGEERQRTTAAFDKLIAAVKEHGLLKKAMALFVGTPGPRLMVGVR